MDRKNWNWLPEHMPGVARVVKEKRKALGDAHVNECWKRGVLLGEPGWFFAREGPLTVGTPWVDDPVMANFAASQINRTQAFVAIREVVSHGAN